MNSRIESSAPQVSHEERRGAGPDRHEQRRGDQDRGGAGANLERVSDHHGVGQGQHREQQDEPHRAGNDLEAAQLGIVSRCAVRRDDPVDRRHEPRRQSLGVPLGLHGHIRYERKSNSIGSVRPSTLRDSSQRLATVSRSRRVRYIPQHTSVVSTSAPVRSCAAHPTQPRPTTVISQPHIPG